MVKVTVYIAAFNYDKYIDKAIDSVLIQNMDDWELIIINDGSTDNTKEVINRYCGHKKIKIIEQENKGLNCTNNIALRLATGKYIVRLDADDYLDENALMILSNILDTKTDVDLVYPDYYLIDSEGLVIDMIRRKKIEDEVQLLDLPAHGACTMFRTDVLKQIGGYVEEFTCQDGYEMWLRFIKSHKPYNVNIPLFYYRQHDSSLTTNQQKILKTRMKIKKQFVDKNCIGPPPKVLGIIPASRKTSYRLNDPLSEIAGHPLIWYTLEQVRVANGIDKVVVSSENDKVLKYCDGFPGVFTLKRNKKQNDTLQKSEELAEDVLDYLKNGIGYEPDAVCMLFVNTPLRKAHHIDWAINTMRIFNVETVVSIQEELAHCYHHRKFGLIPISASRNMRLERDAIYKENGAIFLTKTDVIKNKKLIGDSVGHISMLQQESIKINSDYEYWLADKLLRGEFSKSFDG